MDWNNFVTKTRPYTHQAKAYEKCYGKEYFALFMEQGTGKSKTYIDIASNLFKEGKINAVMLIAPNGVHAQWANEQLPIHSPVPYKAMIWNKSSSRIYKEMMEDFIVYPLENNALKWLCINVEAFSSNGHMKTFIEYLINNKVALCVDESTRIKNPKANRTVNIMYNLKKIKRGGRSKKKVLAVEERALYRTIMTGTMVTNSPYDLWSMIESIKHDFFGMNYYSFKARYGMEIKDSIEDASGNVRTYHRQLRNSEIESILRYHKEGKHNEAISYIMGVTESTVDYVIKHPDNRIPYKHLDELKQKINDIAYIVRKEDCLDLPPKVYEQLYVEMSPDQKRIYKELQKEFFSEYLNKEVTVQNKLSLLVRLQQVTGGFFPYNENQKGKVQLIGSKNPKVEVLLRDLEEYSWSSPVIIWARFVPELLLLNRELKKAYPDKVIELYYGGVYDEKRVTIKKDFAVGKVDILIANKTAGTGLNLQRSNIHYFFSNSYSLEDRVQQEDRSHRIGQSSNKVLYKDIIIQDTVDEKVYEVLSKKKELLDYFRNSSMEEFLGGKII